MSGRFNEPRLMGNCENCYYATDKSLKRGWLERGMFYDCHRYPMTAERERGDYCGEVAEFENRIETLSQENAKLRELVMDMWHELNYTSVRAEDGSNGCLERVLGFDKRMRDLGIEEL